jgi:hypothetical protein
MSAQAVTSRLFASRGYLLAKRISVYLSTPHSEVVTDTIIRNVLDTGSYTEDLASSFDPHAHIAPSGGLNLP